MLSLLGVVLVWGGCGMIGFCAAARLHRRVSFLVETGRMLERMERELLLKHTPIPELLDLLCGLCKGETYQLLFDCRTGIEKGKSFTESWEQALKQTELTGEDRDLLACLTQILGRYDAKEQRDGLSHLRAEVEQRAEQGRAQAGVTGRMYCALGLAAGGFLGLSLL